MSHIDNYEIHCGDRCRALAGVSMERAYEIAAKIAFAENETANVWRNYGEHFAMLASVYPDGKVVGITPKDTWELVAAALG